MLTGASRYQHVHVLSGQGWPPPEPRRDKPPAAGTQGQRAVLRLHYTSEKPPKPKFTSRKIQAASAGLSQRLSPLPVQFGNHWSQCQLKF